MASDHDLSITAQTLGVILHSLPDGPDSKPSIGDAHANKWYEDVLEVLKGSKDSAIGGTDLNSPPSLMIKNTSKDMLHESNIPIPQSGRSESGLAESEHLQLVESLYAYLDGNSNPRHDVGLPIQSFLIAIINMTVPEVKVRFDMPPAFYRDMSESDKRTDPKASFLALVPVLQNNGEVYRHCVSTPTPAPEAPMICFADEKNIIPLLHSTLRERQLLRVQPVIVGVLIPSHVCAYNSDPRIRILAGWIDKSQDGSEQASVHIALSQSSDDPTMDNGPGVFRVQNTQAIFSSMRVLAKISSLSANPILHTTLGSTQSTYEPENNTEKTRTEAWVDEILEHENRDSDHELRDTPSRFTWKRSPYSYRVWDRNWNSEISELNLEHDSKHGVNEWSFDHHVLSIPLTPEDVQPEFGLKHGDMLKKYRSLFRPDPHYAISDSEGSDLAAQLGMDRNSSTTGPTIVRQNSSNSERLTGASALAQALVVASRIEPRPRWAPTPLQVWTYIEQWFTTSPGSKAIENYHFLSRPRGLKINATGCRTLDELALSLTGPEPPNPCDLVPHDGFRERVVAHVRLLEKVLDYASFSAKSAQSSTIDEGFYAWNDAWEMAKALPMPKGSESKVEITRKEPRVGRLKNFQLRLEDYPTLVAIDAAVTTSIDGFLENLALPQQLVDRITLSPFFEPEPSCTNGGKFYLPVLLIKHQDRLNGTSEPTNATRSEQRVCVASAVYFLKALGIQEFPVYGLAICGFRAYLSQAWYSTEDDCCYILDRGIAKHPFDLTTEDGICRFVTFQSQLREHAKSLQERLNSSLVEIKEVLSNPSRDFGILQWSKEAQLSVFDMSD